MKHEIEVLAPAGDFDTLQAAIEAGADAVYVGGKKFGARAYAKNFSEEELVAAIDYVHLHGRKIYLTVNTLIKEREFDELYDYLLPYYEHGLDAVIVQDVGAMDYIMKQFPGLGIHASTQMTITNSISAQYLESIGVERVVPARELSLKEIRKIRDNTSLEIECFVHGALCYCYSGQCLLSSMIGGRSGNRGQCAQPCRLPYQVNHEKKAKDILSLKDLCTIHLIPELIESGITSFKIEGRMKQPSYVALVTKMYRKYVDLYINCGKNGFRVSESDEQELKNAYQRRGYCDGYYRRHNGKEMLSLERPKQDVQKEWKPEAKRKEKISGKLVLRTGEQTSLLLQFRGIEVQVYGGEAQMAANQPISRERVEKQMKKTGNTPFEFEHLDVEITGNVFVPIQILNDLRRTGLERLEKEYVQSYHRDTVDRIDRKEIVSIKDEEKAELQANSLDDSITGDIRVSVETVGQFRTVLNHSFVSIIYVEDALWANPEFRDEIKELIRNANNAGKKVYFAMTRIFRTEAERFYEKYFDSLKEYFDGILVRNMEAYLYVKKKDCSLPVVLDAGVYQWNHCAKNFWMNREIEHATAPVELNFWELKELGIEHAELIVYGYQPVMISAGCVKKHTGKCDAKSTYTWLTDRYHNKNLIKNECVFCYNVIYNSMPLMLFDQTEDLGHLNPESLRLQFSFESEAETKHIMELAEQSLVKNMNLDLSDLQYTRGHFRRGVR